VKFDLKFFFSQKRRQRYREIRGATYEMVEAGHGESPTL
jgi:hypothetical protein